MESCIFGKWCYYDCAISLKAHNHKESRELFDYIESYKYELFFVGFVEYGFYRYMYDKHYESIRPYCVFYGFRRRKLFTPEPQVQERFAPTILQPLDKVRYGRDFRAVKDAIACGRSYEVNLTQELVFSTKVDSMSLFCLLCARQDTDYKAFIPEENGAIISLSPELFFKKRGNRITTKPMKGTMPKGKGNKRKLRNDGKNRSENLMIVDLLRNDLAKIGKNLRAKLFTIESYPTLYQMTSTITAKLKKRVDLYAIFMALFPCGSITGAPKRETINLIEELEKRERGIYCGSIGVVHNDNATFNVAIRTLRKSGDRCSYGVGSGVVWESNMLEEWDELALKAGILRTEFYLFETMLLKGDTHIVLLHSHIQRLLDSANKLGFDTGQIGSFVGAFRGLESTLSKDFLGIDRELFGETMEPEASPISMQAFDRKQVLRLVLYKDGTLESTTATIQDSTSDTLLLSPITIQSASDPLYHKSSLRAIYDAQSFLWRENRCYDVAFFNEMGELCEGSRSNIVVQNGGRFYTPPIKSGLLNGVYRRFLLQQGAIEERVLYAEDLTNADAIYCINSVRGVKKVRL